MSFSVGSIKAKMVLDKSQFEKSAKQVNNATKKVAGQAKKTGTAMKGMWKQMAIGLGVTGGITMVVRGLMRQMSDTIKVGRSFEKEWANVTTMLDISRSATEKMKHELRMLSPTLGDTTDLAKGMYQVLSASIEPAKAIKFLGEAAKSAKAGVTDTKTAVDALTTVINAYGMEAEDVTGISDIMFATVKRGKLTYAELATSLGTVVPVAATVGVEFKEIAAATATLTRQGINAGKATMQLRQVMMAVLKPSEEAKETAERLGIEFTSTALKAKGLSKFLFDVKEKTKGSSDDMAKLVPNVRALTAVMALAGEQAGELAYDVEFMGNAVGLTDEAFRKQMESVDAWIEVFKVAADKIKIAIYEGLTSQLRESIRTAEDFDEKVTKATNDVANEVSLHVSAIVEEFTWYGKVLKKADKILFGWADNLRDSLDSTDDLAEAQGRLTEALVRAGTKIIITEEETEELSKATKTLAERAGEAFARFEELSAFTIDWEALTPPSELMARWEEFYNLVETPELELIWEQQMQNMEEDTLNFMATIIPGMQFMTTSITDDFEEIAKKSKVSFEEIANFAGNFFTQMGNLSQVHFDNELAMLNNETLAKREALTQEYEDKRKAIEDSLLSEEEKIVALLALDLEYQTATEKLAEETEKTKKAIQKKAFESHKKIQKVTAVIDIASAVIEALPNLFLAAFAAATGAVQLAVIGAQKFPSAERGAYLPSPTLIEAGHGPKGEVVLPLDRAPQAFKEMGVSTASKSSIIYEIHFQVQALDAVDVDRWFRDVGTKQIEELLRRNQGGITEKAAGYIKQY